MSSQFISDNVGKRGSTCVIRTGKASIVIIDRLLDEG